MILGPFYPCFEFGSGMYNKPFQFFVCVPMCQGLTQNTRSKIKTNSRLRLLKIDWATRPSRLLRLIYDDVKVGP